MRPYVSLKTLSLSVAVGAATLAPATVSYTIQDLGVYASSDATQGMRISTNGNYATGRNLSSKYAYAFRWNRTTGTAWMSNSTSPAKAYGVGYGVNDSGTIAGIGAGSASGSSKIPLVWLSGSTTPTALTLPTGYTVGDANDINNSDLIVGSVGSSTGQRAVVYKNGVATVVDSAPIGHWTTMFSVNNSGIAAGSGLNSAGSITYGLIYDSTTGVTTSIGCLTDLGHTWSICYDISDNGYVVGSSSAAGASGRAFIWSATEGMKAIPLPTGTTIASARGVNSSGWVVGNGSSAYSIPYLYDGTTTYRLADIIEGYSTSGWDLLTNTSSAAYGISENGSIVGTGYLNGKIHAFVLTQVVPEPVTTGALLVGLAGLALRRRSKK